MSTRPRPKSAVAGPLPRTTTAVFVSVKVVQLGLLRHGGSDGLWQHASRVGRVTGVVPSLGSRTCVAVPDICSSIHKTVFFGREVPKSKLNGAYQQGL